MAGRQLDRNIGPSRVGRFIDKIAPPPLRRARESRRRFARPWLGSGARPPLSEGLEELAEEDVAWRLSYIQQTLRDLHGPMRTVESVLDGRSADGTPWQPRDLKDLLAHSRNCQSSDPRDRLYAFIGLSKPEYRIVVDYTWQNTVVSTFIEAAQRIIAVDGDLSILSHAAIGRRILGFFLPKWVPDWLSPVDVDLRAECRKLLGNKALEAVNASKGLRAEPAYWFRKDSNDVALKVEGVTLGILDQAADESYDELHKPKDYQVFKLLEGSLWEFAVVSRAAREGDEVWMLCGAKWPVVLRRPSPHLEVTYDFIGEAMILTPGPADPEAPGPATLIVADVMSGSEASRVVNFTSTLEEIYLG